MIRTLMIYLAVLTSAELLTAPQAHAGDQPAIVFEQMKPVHADGMNVAAPKIMDFTKDPDADQTASTTRRHSKKLLTKR